MIEPDVDTDSPHAARKFDLSAIEGLEIIPGPLVPDEGDDAVDDPESRYNPNHGEDGKFTSGHGHGHGHGGGDFAQPHPHQINPPTPDGASTAEGHDIKGEVQHVEKYAYYSKPKVYGVPIPDLSDSQRAKLDARIDFAMRPPKGVRRPERWPGRDENDVYDHVLGLHPRIGKMDAHVRKADGLDTAFVAALRHPSRGPANARALAYARAIMPAIDRKVKSGELVRTFVNYHAFAGTTLRPAHVAASASPSAETSP